MSASARHNGGPHSDRSKRTLAAIAACTLIGGLALVARSQIAPLHSGQAPPAPDSRYDAAQVTRGAWLASIGNCNTCHTADGGATFAGGRPLSTPFGTIYATNITPDPETGIGRWTASDFRRAMHEGVDREGHDLYPAFPYDYFTHVADEDVDAIYAFLMTRDEARVATPANRIVVPRAAIGVWKALYFKPGAFTPDPAHDAVWNRGRYLVDGLGHCGGCHTPRNALGAEKPDEDLAGGAAEGWRAPALNESSPAPVPWTVEQIATYLRTGFDAAHGSAAGSMASVWHNLAQVPASEVTAMAVYLESRMRSAGAHASRSVEPSAHNDAASAATALADGGEAMYRDTCAGCHDQSRRGIALERSTSTTDTSPANLIRVILEGIHPREGEKGGVMPAFSGALDDARLAALIGFVRARFGRAPPWPDVGGEIAKAKRAREDAAKDDRS